MEPSYTFTVEEQIPSALNPSPQGFALNQFLEEDFLELPMNDLPMVDLPMNDPKVNELLLTDLPIHEPIVPELPIFQNHASWAASGLAYRSREPSVLVSEPPRYPSIEEWDRIRPIFTKLYSKENRTLKEVKSILERDHDFVATERMYKKRIAVWNLCKNLKKAEKAALVRRVRQTRGAEGMFFRGRPIQHRLERYCRENPSPREGLGSTLPRKMSRCFAYPVRASGESESAEHRLQSFCPSSSQPLQPIALYGDIRSVELIIWNIEAYVNFYLTTGPGTRYFRKDTAVAVRKGLPAQSSVLVKNEGAWKNVVDPGKMFNHLCDAISALNYGFIDSAFKSIDKATKIIKVTLQQQAPSLLAYLIPILTELMQGSSRLGQETLQFILGMTATVLGERHPMSVVANAFCTLSSRFDKCYVWRGVTDALSKSFAVLEDSQLLDLTRRRYFHGLESLGLTDEAQNYLDVIYYQDGKVEETNPGFVVSKAFFLIQQCKYMEAESQCMRILDVVQEVEHEVLADTTSSKSSIILVGDVFDYLHLLALALRELERIEEAKAVGWRAFEFASAVWGLDNVATKLAGSRLDDLLTDFGYMEESEALRAQHLWLLRRQEIPQEYL